MNKFLRYSIIFSLILVSSSVAYHFIIFLPAKELVRIQEKENELEVRGACYKGAKEIKGDFEVQSLSYEFCLSRKGLKK